MAELNYPNSVVLGDITVRDGFQHEEIFIPTDAKLWLAEELILAGFKRIEVTNFGNPRGMPQFKDADELMQRLHKSKKVGNLLKDIETTAVTIRERSVDRAMTFSLAVEPGAMALTQILSPPSSRASDRVIPTTAAFDAS